MIEAGVRGPARLQICFVVGLQVLCSMTTNYRPPVTSLKSGDVMQLRTDIRRETRIQTLAFTPVAFSMDVPVASLYYSDSPWSSAGT